MRGHMPCLNIWYSRSCHLAQLPLNLQEACSGQNSSSNSFQEREISANFQKVHMSRSGMRLVLPDLWRRNDARMTDGPSNLSSHHSNLRFRSPKEGCFPLAARFQEQPAGVVVLGIGLVCGLPWGEARPQLMQPESTEKQLVWQL